MAGHRCFFLWSKEQNSKLSWILWGSYPSLPEGKRAKAVPKDSVRAFHLSSHWLLVPQVLYLARYVLSCILIRQFRWWRECIKLMKAQIMSLYPFNGKTIPHSLNWLFFKELQVNIEGHGQSRADTPSSLEQGENYQPVGQAYTFPMQTRKEGSAQSEINPLWNPPLMIPGNLSQIQECKGLR